MGLARDRPVGSPSGDRQSTTHGCYRGCRHPETGSDSPVVTRTADFDGRGGDHTAEGGGGRPAPEPQCAPRGVRAVPKPFPDDFPEDSLRDGGLRQKDRPWICKWIYGVVQTEGIIIIIICRNRHSY